MPALRSHTPTPLRPSYSSRIVQEFPDESCGQLGIVGIRLRHHGFAEVVSVPTGQDQQARTRNQTRQLDGMLKSHDVSISNDCLLYTSDAADERSSVDLGGRRI